MPTFTVLRDGSVIADSVFDVDPVVDTANPFGDYCVIKMDDRGGQKFANYERGTRVEVEISPDDDLLTIEPGEIITTDSGTTDTYGSVHNAGTYSNQGTVEATSTGVDRFTGYVVERRETEQSGADVLEVEAYSFDQFLRRNTVTNDQRGNTIAEALADIIQTDTPVSYVAGNVTVGDDQELTRSYQGESVETVLRDLAFKSNNEDFGVNDSLEFFFRPRETVHIDRGIDNTQWFNYDIPELGKEAINEVEVWFDDGDRSVIVDDGTDKLDLQDNLGLPDPGTQRQELQRPLITNIYDAEDIGRKYLTFRNATLSGTVTTFGLFDAEPGDTIDITIDPRGIDAEFVIAAIEYRWGRDETILTIVEKRGDVDDILAELSDSVQRQEMQGANRDGTKNRITTTNAAAIVSVTADADGTTPDAARFVNSGRNAVRDGWTGDAPPDVTTLVVGDSNAGLSRSNTALANQTNSATVSQSLPDATSVEFSASIIQSGVEEIGLEAADGTLITRATFENAVELDGTVSVTLDVSNDDSVSRGVLTTDGQTAIRDILADNSPAVPTDYAYGSDGSTVAESDTTLGNEVVSVGLDDVLLERIESQSDWESVVPDFADDIPLTVKNGELTPQRVTQLTEAEDLLNFVGQPVGNADVDGVLSDDDGIALEIANDFIEFEFEFPYDVPSGESFADFYYTCTNFTGEGEVTINGTVVETFSFNDRTVENSLNGSGTVDKAFEAGETNTMRIELTSVSNSRIVIDTMQVIDDGGREAGWNITRGGTFDANTASFDAPELAPDLQEVLLSEFPTRRDITEARAELTIDDTTNQQFIELSNDGTNFVRTDNSSTASASFANPNRGLFVRLGLSRWAAESLTTPSEGDSGQAVDVLELYGNPDAVVTDGIGTGLTRAVIAPNTITGETIRECGLKNGSTLLSHHQLAEFTVQSGERLTSSETTTVTGDT